MMDTEDKARHYIKELKAYYTNLVIYGTIVMVCLVVWLSTGGSFWPIWVLLALGTSAFIQGLQLGAFPKINDCLPFLRADWEEKRLKELFEKDSLKEYKKSDGLPIFHKDPYRDPTDDQGA